jgi:hypothetical protein
VQEGPKNTRPAHDLAACAGYYHHPADGVMSIKEPSGALHWSWRGMFAAMIHRDYETFELPEVPDRLLPNRLAITIARETLSVFRRRSSRWSGISCPCALPPVTVRRLSVSGVSAHLQ